MMQTYHWGADALRQAFGWQPRDRADFVLRHPLRLQSAYAACLGREPAFTSANCRTTEAVDFIAFTPDAITVESGSCSDAAQDGGGDQRWGMRVRGVLDVPPGFAVAGGCPHVALPSDHICLVADFDIVCI